MDLDGLRVLITRPAGRADDLVRAIEAAGGAATHVPLLTVSALDPQRDAAIIQHTVYRLSRLTDYRRVIAISVNAVHYGMTLLGAVQTDGDRSVPSKFATSDINWYGIGVATIAELARWGISARGGTANANSEALLALPELQSVRGDAILILRGIGGRETLAGVLRERGAQVDYAECYRRSAAVLDDRQWQLLLQPAFDAVCVNSAETLHNLWHYLTLAERAKRELSTDELTAPKLEPMLPEAYRRIAIIVPSERVAQLATDLGFVRIVNAMNAGTAATLMALHTIATQR